MGESLLYVYLQEQYCSLCNRWLVYLTLNQVGDIVMRSMDPRSEWRSLP